MSDLCPTCGGPVKPSTVCTCGLARDYHERLADHEYQRRYFAAVRDDEPVRLPTYEDRVKAMADALHEDCRLEWQAIAVADPERMVTQHMADAHYGKAHDLVRRLDIDFRLTAATTPSLPVAACTCLPEPDGWNDACPAHGIESATATPGPAAATPPRHRLPAIASRTWTTETRPMSGPAADRDRSRARDRSRDR